MYTADKKCTQRTKNVHSQIPVSADVHIQIRIFPNCTQPSDVYHLGSIPLYRLGRNALKPTPGALISGSSSLAHVVAGAGAARHKPGRRTLVRLQLDRPMSRNTASCSSSSALPPGAAVRRQSKRLAPPPLQSFFEERAKRSKVSGFNTMPAHVQHHSDDQICCFLQVASVHRQANKASTPSAATLATLAKYAGESAADCERRLKQRTRDHIA